MESQTRLTRISGSRFLTFCQKAPRPPFGKPDEDKAWLALKELSSSKAVRKLPPAILVVQILWGGLQGEGTGEKRRASLHFQPIEIIQFRGLKTNVAHGVQKS